MNLKYDVIKRETDLAILFVFGDQEQWIPKSVIKDIDPGEKEVSVRSWFCKNEGLEAYEVEPLEAQSWLK